MLESWDSGGRGGRLLDVDLALIITFQLSPCSPKWAGSSPSPGRILEALLFAGDNLGGAKTTCTRAARIENV